MRHLIAVLLLFAVGFALRTAEAHHPGHSVSVKATGQYNPFLQGTGRPRKSLTYTFGWSHLDNGAGDVYLNQFGGEYAVVNWLSLTARVPVLSLQMNFRPDKTGLGDVTFGAKGLLLNGESHVLLLGNDFSFPTGDRDNGTGAGAVFASPYLSYQYDPGPVQVFSSLGTSVGLSSDPEPALSPSAGIAVPIKQKNVPVTAFLTIRADVLLADETFKAGSAKVYALPGLIIYPIEDKRLGLTLSGTISIGDTLEVKEGVVLIDSSLALTQDVLVGANFEINYSF